MNRLIFTVLAAIVFPLAIHATGFKAVVIPVEFRDVAFSDKAANVDAKVARARKYFNDQFYPQRTFTFDILPVVSLPREISWYGGNSTSRKDERIDQLVRDACAALQADLSVYDNDNDGKIDNICIIAAGPSEADGGGADYVWPQQAYLSERSGTFGRNGKTVDSYTVCAEFSGVGTFCHEFAHTFGLQDLYDTDGNSSGGESKGLWGSISLMDKGLKNDSGNTPPNFTAIELEQLGLGNPVEKVHGYHILRPISTSKEYLRIDSDTENEYFLLECRDNSGWDAYIGGRGLIIYHIDKSANNSWYSASLKRSLAAYERWELNQVNCRQDHQCAYILEAKPGATSVSQVFYPQEGHNILGSESDPAFRFWSGKTADISIDGITLRPDGSVVFSVMTPITTRVSYFFQDAAIFSWSTDAAMDVTDCEASWYPEGQKTIANTKTQKLKRQEDGYMSITVEGLEPATTYVLTAKITCSDGTIYTKTESFTTKSRQKGTHPFIYLNLNVRDTDGSFSEGGKLPLRVFNATDATAVQWYFNEKYITPEADGFWYIPGSGTLKATVWYKDGTKDVIIKEITVK